MPVSIVAELSVGISRWNTVMSWPVWTCWPGAGREPIAWRKSLISLGENRLVPLNAMRATKRAIPRWSSSSSTEPAWSASHS